MMIGLAAVTIVIIVVAAGALFLQQRDGNDDDEGQGKDVGGGPGNWTVGDYWQYSERESGTGIYADLDLLSIVDRYQVSSVNDTNITIWSEHWSYNYNHTTGGRDIQIESYNQTMAINWTFWGYDYYDYVRSGNIKVGNESLDTEWGLRTAEHYRSDEDTDTAPYRINDWWFVNDIMVKHVIRTTTTDLNNVYIRTQTIDTNLPQIVKP